MFEKPLAPVSASPWACAPQPWKLAQNRRPPLKLALVVRTKAIGEHSAHEGVVGVVTGLLDAHPKLARDLQQGVDLISGGKGVEIDELRRESPKIGGEGVDCFGRIPRVFGGVGGQKPGDGRQCQKGQHDIVEIEVCRTIPVGCDPGDLSIAASGREGERHSCRT